MIKQFNENPQPLAAPALWVVYEPSPYGDLRIAAQVMSQSAYDAWRKSGTDHAFGVCECKQVSR